MAKTKQKTEVENIAAAIKTINASTWRDKKAMVSELEQKLKDAKERELVEKSDVPRSQYEIARELIKSANWSPQEKERVLMNFEEITAVEQAHEDVESRHRKAQIKEMLSRDPVLNSLKSITKAHRQGIITQPEETALLNNLFDFEMPE